MLIFREIKIFGQNGQLWQNIQKGIKQKTN